MGVTENGSKCALGRESNAEHIQAPLLSTKLVLPSPATFLGLLVSAGTVSMRSFITQWSWIPTCAFQKHQLPTTALIF